MALMKIKLISIILLVFIASGNCLSNAEDDVVIDTDHNGKVGDLLALKQSSRDAMAIIDIRSGHLLYTIKNSGDHDSQISSLPIMDYEDFIAFFSCVDASITEKRTFKVSMRANWEELTFPKIEKFQRIRNLLLFRNEFFCKSAPIWKFSFWGMELFPEKNTKKKNLEYNITSSIRTTVIDGTGNASPSFLISSTGFSKRQIDALYSLHRKAIQAENEKFKTVVVPTPSIPAKLSVRLVLDKSTGDLSISISNEANIQDFHEVCPVRMNVGDHFGSCEQENVFFSRFYASSSLQKVDTEIIHFSENEGERIFDLDGNETIGKECKIWEIAIWSRLVEAIKANRAEKFTIRYPVQVELIGKLDDVPLNEDGFSIVPHEEVAEMTIDYRTMLQMEKLRAAAE